MVRRPYPRMTPFALQCAQTSGLQHPQLTQGCWQRVGNVFVRFVQHIIGARFFVAFLVSSSCFGEPPRLIEVWPAGVPGLRSDASDERLVDGRVENVHRPTLTV